MTIQEADSTLSRSLYYAHGVLSEPIYRVLEFTTRCKNPLLPNWWGQYSTKTREFAYRAFAPTVLFAAAAYLFQKMPLRQFAALTGKTALGLIAFEVVRNLFHYAAFKNQQKPYIHVKGNAKEVSKLPFKLATWNVFGFPAGGNYTYGACSPFRERFPGIVQKIKEQDPDVIVLQECIWDSKIPENFISAFKETYAHFFIHNGPHPLFLESGLLIMSKLPVLSYYFVPFINSGAGMHRGFAVMKVQTTEGPITIIGAHLEANNPENRKSQLEQIHRFAKTLDTDVVFAGDTNIDMKSEEAAVTRTVFNDPLSSLTCTNVFRKKRDPSETGSDQEAIDQIAVIKTPKQGFEIFDDAIVPCYDNEGGLSDHHMVVSTIRKKQPE